MDVCTEGGEEGCSSGRYQLRMLFNGLCAGINACNDDDDEDEEKGDTHWLRICILEYYPQNPQWLCQQNPNLDHHSKCQNQEV